MYGSGVAKRRGARLAIGNRLGTDWLPISEACGSGGLFNCVPALLFVLDNNSSVWSCQSTSGLFSNLMVDVNAKVVYPALEQFRGLGK